MSGVIRRGASGTEDARSVAAIRSVSQLTDTYSETDLAEDTDDKAYTAMNVRITRVLSWVLRLLCLLCFESEQRV